MKKQKKSLKERLFSLLLFLAIVWLVFNVQMVVKRASIFLGFIEMDFHQVKKVDLNFDGELNHRPIVVAHKDHVIVSFSNEITLYSNAGEKIAKQEINSDFSKIVSLSDYFVVADMMQGHLSILDYKGNPVSSILSIGPIADIVEASKNMIAVITMENDLFVYDHEGVMITKIPLPSGELLGLELSADKTMVLTNILESDENKFNSKISSHDMETFVMSSSKNNYDSIIYGVEVINDVLIIIDDEGQRAYDYSEGDMVLWQQERVGTLKHFRIDGNGNIFEVIALDVVEDLMGTTEYRLIGLNLDGRMIVDKTLEHDYDTIALQDGLILLKSDRDVLILDSLGDVIKQFESPRKIISSQWLSNKKILVEYNDYFSIYELKY